MDAVMVFSTRYVVYLLGLLALVPWVSNRLKGREWAKSNCAWRMPLAGFLAAVASFGGNWLISLLWFRDRPFRVLEEADLLISPPLTAHAFPSSHSAVAFAVVFAVVFFHRRYGLALVALAVLVAFSRVFVGVHYPSDVVIGALLGGGWAALFSRLFGAGKCLWSSVRQVNLKLEEGKERQ